MSKKWKNAKAPLARARPACVVCSDSVLERMLDSKGKFMAQHILVTGGAGYIGGSALRLLLQNDYRVTVLENLSRSHPNSLAGGVPLGVADTADVPCLSQVFPGNKFDAVIHFAA